MKRLRRACQRHRGKRKKFKYRAIAAGSAAVITLGTGISLSYTLAGYTPDKHQLSVIQDADSDLLSNKEEIAIGYHPFKADQNRNEIQGRPES
jgi:uncharacterized protein (DUF2141 family)